MLQWIDVNQQSTISSISLKVTIVKAIINNIINNNKNIRIIITILRISSSGPSEKEWHSENEPRSVMASSFSALAFLYVLTKSTSNHRALFTELLSSAWWNADRHWIQPVHSLLYVRGLSPGRMRGTRSSARNPECKSSECPDVKPGTEEFIGQHKCYFCWSWC